MHYGRGSREVSELAKVTIQYLHENLSIYLSETIN